MTLAAERLFHLRSYLKEQKVSGFIVPRTDCFQGEYVAPCDERLAWLTNFTGSAGMAVVLQHTAALFVDGRYTLQAAQQIDQHVWQIKDWTQSSLKTWLEENLHPEDILSYDPWLHTPNQLNEWQRLTEEFGCSLKPCIRNPIDYLWHDRPAAPTAPIRPHSLEWSGEESEQKRLRVQQILLKAHADILVLSSPESIAWLLNIRGGDIPHTPIAHAFALVHADASVDIFVNLTKANNHIRGYCGEKVRWHDQENFLTAIIALEGKTCLIDPRSIPQAAVNALKEAKATILAGDDPCLLFRAIKNDTELKGSHAAHKKDGIALVNFLAWLDEKIAQGIEISEIEAANYLKTQRQQQPHLQDLSFATISAAGANGAIVHYHPSLETDAILKPNTLYLVDSGGQYLDGTTDITRTIALGIPTEEQKDRFTRVLKGHIALATAIFPLGTTGQQLDAFARQYLWQAGLDYGHGTGHGVGSYLSVHEGPQRISKVGSSTPLQPGMILSNEPGYYKAGEYGIRIENLVTVVKAHFDAPTEMLAFETLTLVPIDKRLINTNLLTELEKNWVNNYHQHVWTLLSPHIEGYVLDWLQQSASPL